MGSRHARGLALHVRSYHAVASYRGSVDFLKTAIWGGLPMIGLANDDAACGRVACATLQK